MGRGWFGLGWGCGRVEDVNLRHAVAVERRLSAARAVLAVVSLSALLLEHPHGLTPLGLGALIAFALYSVVQLVVIHRLPADGRPPAFMLHAADVGWAMAVVSANGGIESPFYAYYIFTLLAAGYRWGLVETLLTGAVAVVATAGDVVARLFALPGWTLDVHDTSIRVAYVVVGAVLMGYLAEDERRHRQQTFTVSQIMARIRAHAGLVASVQGVLDGLLRQLCGRRATLVLGEDGSDQVFFWDVEAGEGTRRSNIRLRQEARNDCLTWLFEVPPGVEAVRVRRRDGGTNLDVLALESFGVRSSARVDASPLLSAPFEWREALCLPAMNVEDWHGRLFLFDPRVGGQSLRFLQAVVGQVAPAMFNLYLQRRLQSRSGVVERAQISRQLHDGVIQSLIGIDMQLEVLRRELAMVPAQETETQLESIQSVLGEEILNLRDLMQLLKPSKVEPDRLVEHLTEQVAHFRTRTNIDARLSCDTEDIDLSPRVCQEISAVVREALANVRKHSEATSVLVRLARQKGDWLLTVDDNGRGFGFDGKLEHEELDAQHLGPLLIKERVRSIGGTLKVQSRPGGGSRLDITIPGRHHA